MAHVGADGGEAELGHHLAELVGARKAGRDLGLEVGHVLGLVADRVGPDCRSSRSSRSRSWPCSTSRKLSNSTPSWSMRVLSGGIEPGVIPPRRRVRARRGEEDQLALLEHRHHHRDVGQVRAAVVGIVQRPHVAGLQAAAVELQDRAHRSAHGAQVDRHVRRVGDQRPLGVEHRAGEVEPLLDVDRVGGALVA